MPSRRISDAKSDLHLIAIFAAFMLLATAVLVVCGCSVVRSDPSYFDTITAGESEDFPSTQPLQAAMLDAAPEQWAVALVRYPMSLAAVEGGLPIVVPPQSRPIGGSPFTLAWTTRPTAEFPAKRVALLATLRPPGEPQLIPGGKGGMLQVPPDYVFLANKVPFLTQEAGMVRLDITFVRELSGLRVWLQLLVEDDRVPAGVTVTPMVELRVGSK